MAFAESRMIWAGCSTCHAVLLDPLLSRPRKSCFTQCLGSLSNVAFVREIACVLKVLDSFRIFSLHPFSTTHCRNQGNTAFVSCFGYGHYECSKGDIIRTILHLI